MLELYLSLFIFCPLSLPFQSDELRCLPILPYFWRCLHNTEMNSTTDHIALSPWRTMRNEPGRNTRKVFVLQLPPTTYPWHVMGKMVDFHSPNEIHYTREYFVLHYFQRGARFGLITEQCYEFGNNANELAKIFASHCI